MTYSPPGYVYRLYDGTGRLLYVGFSMWPENRIPQHQGKFWFGDIASATAERHPDRRAALAAEDEAIRTEWPLWNYDRSPDAEVAYRIAHRIEIRQMDARLSGCFRVLHGAAKRSHDARMRRQFDRITRHALNVRRMASAAQFAADYPDSKPA